MKQLYFLFLLFALLTIISACESEPDPNQEISSWSFDLTCKGIGLNQALAYTADDGGINQAIVMSDSTIGAQYDEYTQRHNREMPETWFPQIVDGTFVYDEVELVLCIHRTDVELVDIPCEFEDGYSIKVHNATYELTLRDPLTAEIIDQKSLTNEGDCPNMFSIFTEGQKEEDQFADVEDAQIQKFIQSYIEG